MPLEVGLWRVGDGKPVRLTPSGVPLESELEGMIEADPTILGTPLMLIGRQVPTDFGRSSTCWPWTTKAPYTSLS